LTPKGVIFSFLFFSAYCDDGLGVAGTERSNFKIECKFELVQPLINYNKNSHCDLEKSKGMACGFIDSLHSLSLSTLSKTMTHTSQS